MIDFFFMLFRDEGLSVNLVSLYEECFRKWECTSVDSLRVNDINRKSIIL